MTTIADLEDQLAALRRDVRELDARLSDHLEHWDVAEDDTTEALGVLAHGLRQAKEWREEVRKAVFEAIANASAALWNAQELKAESERDGERKGRRP